LTGLPGSGIWLFKFDLPNSNLKEQGGSMMARPSAVELTDRELEVMHLFWPEVVRTAQEARDQLAKNGRELSYTTVANLVRTLEEKGYLKQINSDRPFQYAPARDYESVSGSMLSDMVQRVFRGSREMLFVRLFDQRKLTLEERELLESLLKESTDE
jgi:BlaI family transcriptional regulator, penicillinase repressor